MKIFKHKVVVLFIMTFMLFISKSKAQLSVHINTITNAVSLNNTQSFSIPISEINLISSTPWGLTTSGVVFDPSFGCANETFSDGTSAYLCYTFYVGGNTGWGADANKLYDLNGFPIAGDGYGGGMHLNYFSIDYTPGNQADGLPLEVNVISGGGGSFSANSGNKHLAYMAPQNIDYIYVEANLGNGVVPIPVYIDGQLLEQDCEGTWGGSVNIDACGVCGGDNSSCSGCISSWASNYDPNATLNDGSCQLSGCTDQAAFNFNENATDDDGSCIDAILGCMDIQAANYNAEANTDNGMCQPYTIADVEAAYNSGFSNGVIYGSPILLDLTLDLPQGWSIFGYTCIDPLNAASGFADISDKIEIVKDEWGLSYIPSWQFNALGDLNFSEGYQIKMSEAVDDFAFCQTFKLKTYGCMDSLASNYDFNVDTDDGSCIFLGCTEITASNFNEDANTDDGSCIILGCMDSIYVEYNHIATEDDGSCNNITILGCTDQEAVNYLEEANTDNGSCNYNACGTLNFDQWPTTATVGDLVSPESNNNDWEITYPGYEGVLVQQHPDYPQLVIELTNPDGSYKNIGIGGPTTDYSPEFHSEWYGLNLAPVILQKLVGNQFNANQAGLVYVTTSSPHPNPTVTTLYYSK